MMKSIWLWLLVRVCVVMLAVERFGLKSPSVSEEKITKGNSDALEKILQKSRQRIHYKSYQNTTHGNLLLSTLNSNPGKNKKSSQPINIDKLLETDEEKKRRKLAAKLEKKERKEKMKEVQEHSNEKEGQGDEDDEIGNDSHTHLNEERDDAQVQVNSDDGEEIIDRQDKNVPEPVSYAPIALPSQDQTSVDTKTKLQSVLIPPAIVIKEKVSILDSVSKWGVDQSLANDIIEDGIEEYFPVQVAVIPLLLAQSTYQPCALPRDMIVSAPTGSGKTLAYALPIIQSLSAAQRLWENLRSNRRLHALVILPSRELVSQVYHVFCRLARNTALRIGQASGQVEFGMEKSMLVSSSSSLSPLLSEILKEVKAIGNTSLVDILVCTPGRLLEHLQSTEGFTLQHLKYIVFDEADRLLSNAYDHWVRALMSSTNPKSNQYLRLQQSDSESHTSFNGLSSYLGGQYLDNIPHIQRLMFSATLTDNPRKLSLSGVRNPLIIRTSASTPYTSANQDDGAPDEISNIEYILPRGLKEWLCICDTTSRPLYLLAILHQLCGLTSSPESPYSLHNICSRSEDLILIFTSSVETTHRLCRLLQLFNKQFQHLYSSTDSTSYVFGGEIQEINRMISSTKRSEILQLARQGSVIKILISSDQLARGIDLQNIRVVINYDSPSHPRTYVHRVGRTARANRIGDCITMIKKGNITQFQKMRNEISSTTKDSNDQVKKNKFNMDRVRITWKGQIISSLKGNTGSGKRKRDTDETIELNPDQEDDYNQFYEQYKYALQHLNDIIELENEHKLRIGEC